MPSPKPTPRTGIRVTWINPCDVSLSKMVMVDDLIHKYGVDGLTILTAEETPAGIIVTLAKYGNLVMDGWDGDPVHTDPEHPATPVPLRVNWTYLRPLESG